MSNKKSSKAVSGTNADGQYDFYHGDVTVTVNGDFGEVSLYCYYHGYMGGENLLKYSPECSNSKKYKISNDNTTAVKLFDVTSEYNNAIINIYLRIGIISCSYFDIK